MKIDVFSHIITKKYGEACPRDALRFTYNPGIGDLGFRLKLLDRYPNVLQVLTLATPPLETIAEPEQAIKLAKIANDELAELVLKYPDKFIAAVASLPLNDMDASLKEAERAITKLHMRGVQIFSNINGESLDENKFKPLYALMASYDLPLWIHPWNSPKRDYSDISNLPVLSFAWPFETTVAMGGLVKAGIFEEYPKIKFITHHLGGMLPYFEGRIKRDRWATKLDYFRKFYNDTALYGNTPALKCGYDYFGVDHVLFGTDMPLGSQGGGYGYTQETINAIERLEISTEDKEKIFYGNAVRLLKLPT